MRQPLGQLESRTLAFSSACSPQLKFTLLLLSKFEIPLATAQAAIEAAAAAEAVVQAKAAAVARAAAEAREAEEQAAVAEEAAEVGAIHEAWAAAEATKAAQVAERLGAVLAVLKGQLKAAAATPLPRTGAEAEEEEEL